MRRNLISTIRGISSRVALWIAAMVLIGGASVFYVAWKNQIPPIDDEFIVGRINEALNSSRDNSRAWLSQTDTSLLRTLWKKQETGENFEKTAALYLLEDDSIKYWSQSLFVSDVTDRLLNPNSSLLEIDGKKVLIFNKRNSSRRVSAIVLVLSDVDNPEGNIFGSGDYLFHSTRETPPSDIGKVQWQQVSYQNISIWVSTTARRDISPFCYLGGWLGMTMLLILILFLLRSTTNRHNVLRMWFAMLVVTGSLRVAFALLPLNQEPSLWMSPYTSGWQVYFFSPFNLFVTAIFTLVLSLYYYSIRHKLKWQLRQHSLAVQYTMWTLSLVLRSAMLIYFHWGFVENIYSQTVNVAFYELFSLNSPGLLLFLSAGIYMVTRLFQSELNKVNETPREFLTHMGFSIVVLFLTLLPLIGKLHGTWPLVIVYSIAFRLTGLLWRRFKPLTLLSLSAALTAMYFTAITMWESRELKIQIARQYLNLVVENEHNPSFEDPPQYDQYSYAFINRYKWRVKNNNRIELYNVLPYTSRDTTINIDGYTNVIYAGNQQAVVISYLDTGILDWISMFCYLYLIYNILSLVILRLLGVNIARGKLSLWSLSFKIQMTLIVMVLFIIGSVTFLFINYYLRNSYHSQNQLMNNKISTMLTSLNLYQSENAYSSDILSQWYERSGKSLGYNVVLYDVAGWQTLDNSNTNAPLLLNSQTLSSIKYCNMPFYVTRQTADQNGNVVIYLPAYCEKKLIGYIGIGVEDPTEYRALYPVLEDLFNLFVVIMVIALWLSVILTNIVTKPLETLSVAMSKIGLLRKIPQELGMDSEIRKLVAQYNQMIDYLDESYTAMARYERESAWQEMARRMAHEIKNPLTPMKLKVQLLQRYRQEGNENLDQKTTETLNLLLEQIDIIAAIVDEFRDFARMRENNPSIINLCTLLSDVAMLYDRYENVDVRYVSSCNKAVWVYADGNQISRVIGNLCKNSAEALSDRAGGVVEITLCTDADYAYVGVRDNGPGISEHIATRIFEPNFTTKEKGSGLGLMISQQIVEAYGGELTFSSQADVGTLFMVKLPLNK